MYDAPRPWPIGFGILVCCLIALMLFWKEKHSGPPQSLQQEMAERAARARLQAGIEASRANNNEREHSK